MSEPAPVLPLKPRHQVLYRMYDASETLLYVGISVSVEARFIDHRDGKPWWPDVTSIKLEHFTSREAVERAEQRAIKAERPLYNVLHRFRPPRPVAEPRPPTKPRVIRMTDDLWKLALATAKDAGENLPDAIRDYVAWYARVPGARAPRRPPARADG